MIRGALAKGNSCLFLASRRDLVIQCAERLWRDHQIEPGVIMRGFPPSNRPVQVASVATLLRRSLPEARLAVADEAHHAVAASFTKILDALPNSALVGLTATPWRLDNRGLKDAFDSLVLAATPQQLLAEGFLCDATGHAYVTPDFSQVAVSHGDYDAEGLSLAYKQSAVLGDIVDRWFAHAAGKRTILFASSIDNSKELVDRFRQRGVNAVHLDCYMPLTERRAIIGAVRSGEATLVSNVGLLGEGLDVPELECCILARPTKSVTVYLQAIGRVLRPAPGKERAIIHDHAGCVATFGFWDATRDYSLTATKKRDPCAAPMKQCPVCFRCLPLTAEVCPECGHVLASVGSDAPPPPTEHRELTLEELRALMAEQGRSDDLFISLMGEAKRRRKAPGWVIHEIRALIDRSGGTFQFPRSLWRRHVAGSKATGWRWADEPAPRQMGVPLDVV